MCEAFLPETKESVSGLQGAKEAQGFSTNCLPLSDPCFWDSQVSRFDMPLLCVFAFQVSNNPFLPLDGGFNAGRELVVRFAVARGVRSRTACCTLKAKTTVNSLSL